MLDKTQYRPKFPDSPFVHIADIVNQETGKTYREENANKAHSIPIGTLVEINYEDCEYNGARLFVVYQSRDCDQTPLYCLALNPTERKREGFYNYTRYNGYSECSLTVIRLPGKQDDAR